MNTYDEVMIATSLIILVLGLFGVTIYFKDKIEKLEDTVTNFDAYINVNLVPQIKTIRQLVTDEIINKKGGKKMQIVIDISDEEYEDVKKTGGCYYDFGKAIYYGTPLPKGHGDLIDRSKLETHYVGTDIGTDLEVYLVPTIVEAPAIVKADKEESEVECRFIF